MYSANSDCDPDIIESTHIDPHNVILNVSKAEDVGVNTSGANPPISAGSQGGFVTFVTNETQVTPSQFSTDPVYTSGDSSGSVGGGGTEPGTGGGGAAGGGTGGDPDPPPPDGGYRHKEPLVNPEDFGMVN